MSGTPIGLFTDYGQRDVYVGVLRSVILDIWPRATLFDLTHDVPPQNLLSGAWLLASAHHFLPKRCIVCAVVDPGVGTERRAVVVETAAGYRFVAPDNGLLELVLRQDPAARAVELDRDRWFLPKRSATFDGRDVFAPVAAQLARGVRLDALGSELDAGQLQRLQIPENEREDGRVRGRVLHIDHFGNVISTLGAGELAARTGGGVLRVRCADVEYPFVKTFADVSPGDRLSYIGSAGVLELAVREGNCAARDGIEQGDVIDLCAAPSP